MSSPNGGSLGGLRARLRAGRPALGVWCGFGSPAVVEAMSGLGPDWLLIDGEHGVGSAETCLPQLQAARAGGGASVLVRLPAARPDLAARVLDAGADGIVVPKVGDVETARLMVHACRYPPQGSRGIGPHRASGYFRDTAGYLASANQQICVVLQIETREGVENLEAIAAVEGLDAVFVGPADLSASLGHFGRPDHPEVVAAIAAVLAGARRAGVAAGIYCGSGREARARIDEGFLLVNVANDMAALVGAVGRELARALGDQVTAAPAAMA